jgi:hypothetical protein
VPEVQAEVPNCLNTAIFFYLYYRDPGKGFGLHVQEAKGSTWLRSGPFPTLISTTAALHPLLAALSCHVRLFLKVGEEESLLQLEKKLQFNPICD